MIAIVDAGLGNLRSVAKAMAAVSGREEVRVTAAPSDLGDAARIVVPGQGAFGDCAAALAPTAPLGAAILDAVRAGKPYLGICLGLQVLFDSSEESPAHPGLGLHRGHVRRLPADAVDETGARLKIPHIGWSRVALRGTHPVFELPSGDDWFYFVHSYHARPADESLVAAVCAFGTLPVTAAVARDNVVGVQFHPEKSQRAGLELLQRFVEWRC